MLYWMDFNSKKKFREFFGKYLILLKTTNSTFLLSTLIHFECLVPSVNIRFIQFRTNQQLHRPSHLLDGGKGGGGWKNDYLRKGELLLRF